MGIINMKTRFLWILIFVLSLALLLSSCKEVTQTDAPSQSENPTEAATGEIATEDTSAENSEIATEDAHIGIPKLTQDSLAFTLNLTQTVYTTSSDKLHFRIKAKEPGGFIYRGDQWRLYSIDNGKATMIGEVLWEITIEYTAPSDDESIEKEEFISIKTLCGKDNLPLGNYCLVYLDKYFNINHTGALMYFDVVD